MGEHGLQSANHAVMQAHSSQLCVHPAFHSRFLPHNRDVTVYLPPCYAQHPDRTYPALYMQDGQNLFASGPEDFYHRSWRIRETADTLIFAGEIEPLIIVGVAHTCEHRLTEYTPTADWTQGGGLADQYGRLLVEELLPFIAANYRVRPGAANAGLGGSSLGGLAALYLGLRRADIFGKLAVLSPSVWWNHRAILALVSELAPNLTSRPRIWLDIGECEGPRTITDTELLDRRLRAKGWRPREDLLFQRVPGGTHDEAAWSQRVAPMLRFLFPAPAGF